MLGAPNLVLQPLFSIQLVDLQLGRVYGTVIEMLHIGPEGSEHMQTLEAAYICEGCGRKELSYDDVSCDYGYVRVLCESCHNTTPFHAREYEGIVPVFCGEVPADSTI